MMKRLLTGVVLAACALGVGERANAQDMGRVFVEAGFGQVFESDLNVAGTTQTAESDPNAFVAIGLAHVAGTPIDVRLDYATTDRYYANSPFAQLQSTSIMLNAAYNIPAGPFELYAGGGVGVVDVSFSSGLFGGVEGSESKFGWQVVGGARAPLFDWPLAAFGELRYQDAGEATIDGFDIEYNSTSAMVGLRWSF